MRKGPSGVLGWIGLFQLATWRGLVVRGGGCVVKLKTTASLLVAWHLTFMDQNSRQNFILRGRFPRESCRSRPI